MKKTLLILSSAALLCTAAGLAACSLPSGGPASSAPPETPDAFDEYIFDSGVIVKADSGAVRIRWGEADGAEKYLLYHSPSRFGAYEKVTELGSQEREYTLGEHLYDYFKVTALVGGEERELGRSSTFSDNTLIVGENDDAEAVQAAIDRTHAALETGAEGQFSSRRAALFFLAGQYDLTARVGYYTSVSGLGRLPTDVSLKSVYVSDKVLANRNSTCTFWRSVENVAVRSDVTWSVSQATSFRRASVEGSLMLSYGGWASGGFLANTVVTGSVLGGTQQQWLTRNTSAKSFNGGSFNMVYTGCEGDLPDDAWTESSGSVTDLPTTERIAEKPYLYREGEAYSVFVPYVEENTVGVTWKSGHESEYGISIPLEDFYIADARYDTADSMNAALDAGKHLLFTPGNYVLDEPLVVKNSGTVLLGVGYATLKIGDDNRDAALHVWDVDGVRVAGILVDAGARSKNMVVIGTEASAEKHTEDPTVLSDLFLRIGGVGNFHTETETALVIQSDDVIGDNFWIWRADHSLGVAWEDAGEGESITYGNPAMTGVEVIGDRVTCYALMVEHFKGFQTVWRGEDGCTVMYQSETPYRVPTQSAWMSHDGEKNGCASYRVEDSVTRHRAIGIGVYLVNYSGMTLDSAIEAPETRGIEMTHLVTCCLSSGNPTKIEHVINDYGARVGQNGLFQARVPKYPI